MKILAIGLGGAGCRIVDSLYATDRRSSKVACVKGLAIDVDENSLKQLGNLPENSKIFFPAMEPDFSKSGDENVQTATIDIAEIVSKVQDIESGEIDAIFFCCGLGGSMTDIAPHIITALRETTRDSIFGLITLPCLSEGKRVAGKAADDIDIISPLLDGVIVFDNETWHHKLLSQKVHLVKKERSLAEKIGLAKEPPQLSPAQAMYKLLNEAIVRRISLILRAGEFKADGGLEPAEVVLDSGEVLNSMKGMGFIAIGYAVEHLPHNPLSFLSRFRPTGFFIDEHQKRASRIVELAKQAIYNEISTPCDMTSAHKALILIAGPSHELSMKGFMTVRKWIDRSIAGLETRSGDYPVTNTNYVAIIVMLSGLENIPRITELREIRAQNNSSGLDSYRSPVSTEGYSGESYQEIPQQTRQVRPTISDEKLILPPKKKTDSNLEDVSARPVLSKQDTSIDDQLPWEQEELAERELLSSKSSLISQEPARSPPASPHKDIPVQRESHQQQRVIVTEEQGVNVKPPVFKTSGDDPAKSQNQITGSGPSGTKITRDPRDRVINSDGERQRIEKELQRQRMMAISGLKPKASAAQQTKQPHASQTRVIRSTHDNISPKTEPVITQPEESTRKIVEKKTVIIQKRKIVEPPREVPQSPENVETTDIPEMDVTSTVNSFKYPKETVIPEETHIGLKESPYKAKDKIFEGTTPKKPPVIVHTKDAALLRTNLKRKKTTHDADEVPKEDIHIEPVEESPEGVPKLKKRILKKDETDWK